jgi:predicted aldo/keto reductase-like oxidoreductase
MTMRQKRLGRTNLMVSEIGFGGIPIQRLSDDEAHRVVTHCLDAGVTFLDTAHGYTTSEERIGRAIAGRRQGLVIATKTPARDAKAAREQIALSFKRLGVEYIDILQFHGVSTPEAFAQIMGAGGAMEAAREAKDAGRVGHIGVTSHSLAVALDLVKSGHFETLMFPFNFIADEAAEELIPLCRQMDVGFIVMKALGGGLLDNARVAFNYLKQFPDLVPIPGIEKPEEIDEIIAVATSSATLSAADREEIAHVSAELGKRFCRRCDYCQPCPQNIRISMVMNFRSFWGRMPAARTLQTYQALMAVAETCQECGECETRCPYNLPVREMLQENISLYKQVQAQQAAG